MSILGSDFIDMEDLGVCDWSDLGKLNNPLPSDIKKSKVENVCKKSDKAPKSSSIDPKEGSKLNNVNEKSNPNQACLKSKSNNVNKKSDLNKACQKSNSKSETLEKSKVFDMKDLDITDWGDARKLEELVKPGSPHAKLEKEIRDEFGGDFIQVKYAPNNCINFYCVLCVVDSNSRKCLRKHCSGLKHLRNKYIWEQDMEPKDTEEPPRTSKRIEDKKEILHNRVDSSKRGGLLDMPPIQNMNRNIRGGLLDSNRPPIQNMNKNIRGGLLDTPPIQNMNRNIRGGLLDSNRPPIQNMNKNIRGGLLDSNRPPIQNMNRNIRGGLLDRPPIQNMNKNIRGGLLDSNRPPIQNMNKNIRGGLLDSNRPPIQNINRNIRGGLPNCNRPTPEELPTAHGRFDEPFRRTLPLQFEDSTYDRNNSFSGSSDQRTPHKEFLEPRFNNNSFNKNLGEPMNRRMAPDRYEDPSPFNGKERRHISADRSVSPHQEKICNPNRGDPTATSSGRRYISPERRNVVKPSKEDWRPDLSPKRRKVDDDDIYAGRARNDRDTPSNQRHSIDHAEDMKQSHHENRDQGHRSNSQNTPPPPPPPKFEGSIKMSITKSSTGSLLLKLADCCVKSSNDADLAFKVINILIRSMKDYCTKEDQSKIEELLSQAEYKLVTFKALKVGMEVLSSFDSKDKKGSDLGETLFNMMKSDEKVKKVSSQDSTSVALTTWNNLPTPAIHSYPAGVVESSNTSSEASTFPQHLNNPFVYNPTVASNVLSSFTTLPHGLIMSDSTPYGYSQNFSIPSQVIADRYVNLDKNISQALENKDSNPPLPTNPQLSSNPPLPPNPPPPLPPPLNPLTLLQPPQSLPQDQKNQSNNYVHQRWIPTSSLPLIANSSSSTPLSTNAGITSMSQPNHGEVPMLNFQHYGDQSFLSTLPSQNASTTLYASNYIAQPYQFQSPKSQ